MSKCYNFDLIRVLLIFIFLNFKCGLKITFYLIKSIENTINETCKVKFDQINKVYRPWTPFNFSLKTVISYPWFCTYSIQPVFTFELQACMYA